MGTRGNGSAAKQHLYSMVRAPTYNARPFGKCPHLGIGGNDQRPEKVVPVAVYAPGIISVTKLGLNQSIMDSWHKCQNSISPSIPCRASSSLGGSLKAHHENPSELPQIFGIIRLRSYHYIPVRGPSPGRKAISDYHRRIIMVAGK